MADEGERALDELLEAVAIIAAIVGTRPRSRDALIALRDPNLCTLTTRIAAAFGFRTFLAESGAEAAATATGRAFDLIMIEASWDAPLWARRIRALPLGLNVAPIIALGACPGPLWRADAAEAGIDALVATPLAPARLVDVIALLTHAQTGARREA
jgi:DNA-binding response OmpR family regulator